MPAELSRPSFLEHVSREAHRRLDAGQRTPLLLLRMVMLLQDAVEAACMCARAHIDAPQLAKHLLSNEQYQTFRAAAMDDTGADPDAEAGAEEYASAVKDVVGVVRIPFPAARGQPHLLVSPAPWDLPVSSPYSFLPMKCETPTPFACQTHAASLGAILHHLCCSVLDAVRQLPPSPPLGAGRIMSCSAHAAAPDDAADVPQTLLHPNTTPLEAISIRSSARGSSCASIGSANLLPIDRALVLSSELRQTCNTIELLRSAIREGSPVHEWKLNHFSSQGPSKVASPSFDLYGRRWCLLLHPRGCGANAQGTHISAYLRLEHGPACDARVRLAVRNHRSPTLSTFNKPWQWRFDSNGKNRGVSSLLPLSSANAEAGFVVDDALVLQLWLRPLGAAESKCLPPGAEDGLPAGDMLQPAARCHFHAKLLLVVCEHALLQRLEHAPSPFPPRHASAHDLLHC